MHLYISIYIYIAHVQNNIMYTWLICFTHLIGAHIIKLLLTSYTAVISGGALVLQTTHGCGLGRHGSPLHSVKFRLALISSMASTTHHKACASRQDGLLEWVWRNHPHSLHKTACIKLIADNNYDVPGIQKKIHLNLWFLDPIHIFVDKTELNIKLKESQMQMMES